MSPIKPPYDPELLEGLNAFPPMPDFTLESLAQIRKSIEPLVTIEANLTDPAITHEEKFIPGPGGDIALAILRSRNSAGGKRPGIVFYHGGGMIMGTRFFGVRETVFEWIKELDITIVSVEYRLAPEYPDPAPVEDCYAGLKWVSEHASELGIDVDKIMIAGISGGGGVCAGTALLARDRGGPSLVAQCLVYPMIDDRNNTASAKQFMKEGIWTGEKNARAWDWITGGKRGSKDVSIYAAPARATDLSGLPPTWIDCGGAEVFRDENIAYASKLLECGVNTELHVWPGAWHGFDMYLPETKLAKISLATRMAWVKRIVTAEPVGKKLPPVL